MVVVRISLWNFLAVVVYITVAFLIYRILLIELSVLSQFQIPLKLRRRVIIARIIRSGYNLVKLGKDWLPLKHFKPTLITE